MSGASLPTRRGRSAASSPPSSSRRRRSSALLPRGRRTLPTTRPRSSSSSRTISAGTRCGRCPDPTVPRGSGRDVHRGVRRARSAVRAARRSSRGVPAHHGRLPADPALRRLRVVRRLEHDRRRSTTRDTPPASSGSTSTPTSRTRSPGTCRPDGTAGSRSCTPSTWTTGSRSTARSTAGTAPEEYSTEVLVDQAETFVRRTDGPVFAVFAPAAPHAPAIPAGVDGAGFEDLPRGGRPRSTRRTVPTSRRTSGVPARGAERTAAMEELRRNQYQALQAVDRSVGRLLDALEDTGRLDDALVIFTTDNGQALGRAPVAEEGGAVRRGDPGPAGGSCRRDRRPGRTRGRSPRRQHRPGADDRGGRRRRVARRRRSKHAPAPRGRRGTLAAGALIEHLQGANPIPTYCGVRTASHVYVSYRTGEHELYDLRADPHEWRTSPGRNRISRPAWQRP